MSQPVIILVEPQLVENIGMTARAMMNCGLMEMRLVDPRDEWPLHEIMEERMMGAASGADEILRNAKICSTRFRPPWPISISSMPPQRAITG